MKPVNPTGNGRSSVGADTVSVPPIIDAIVSAAAADPNAMAVYAGTSGWSFSELLTAAGQVCERITCTGTDATPVAFVAKRSAASLAIMLGSLFAGRQFAPIDPQDPNPLARARRMGAHSLIMDPDSFLDDGRCIDLEWPTETIEQRAPRPAPAYRLLTSGTSAHSKLVEVSRSNLSGYVAFFCSRLRLYRPIRWAVVSSLATDLSYTAIFPVLASGGSVHIVDDGARRDARAFRRYLAAHRIEAVKMTPSHCRALLCASDERIEQPLRFLVLGGELLPPELAATVFDTGRAEQIVNHYGPTETTIGVACHIATSRAKIHFDKPSLPIGLPLGHAELIVVDDSGRPVSIGEVGELLVGGPTVATGYVNDPALSAQRFIVADPDGSGPRRFFRTQDLCKRLENGELEFVRRGGTEIKIRGWRVEPADIEQTICALPGVRDARVVVDGEGAAVSLNAVVVSDVQTSSGVRSSLAEKLPPHLVPRRIAIVEALPLLNSGKFDQATALRFVHESGRIACAAIELDELVEEIADLMAPYLGGLRPGPSDDFFGLGGDSLAAIHLLSRLQDCGHDLTAEALLSDLTPKGVAASIRSARSVLDQPRRVRFAGGLSPAQKWFFAQSFAEPGRWCQAVALNADGPIDNAALDAALNWIVGRHPLLRCRFENDSRQSEGWCCCANGNAPAVRARAEDGDGSEDGLWSVTERLLREIDIVSGRLLAAAKLSAPDSPDRVVIVVHHLVMDGVSWRILLDDFAAAYQAALDGSLTEPHPEPGAFWDWVDALGPLPPAEGPSSDAAEPATDATAVVTLDETMTAALDHLALQSGFGLQTVLLAAFAVEWTRLTGEETLTLDIEGHGRTESAANIGRSLGWFTRTATVSLTLPGAGDLDTLLAVVGASMGAAESHDHTYRDAAPLCFNFLGRLIAPADSVGRWSYSPLVLGPLRGGVRRRHVVTLSGRIVGGRLSFDVVFDTRRLSGADGEALARRIATRLASLVGQLTAGPAEAPAIRMFAWSTVGQLALALPAKLSLTQSVVRSEPRALLTGATGLLGSYLLRELLQGSAKTIVCLVRPSVEASGAARLAHSFSQYFDTDVRAYGDRVRVIEGDVTKPQLGLRHELHQELAQRLDMIVHSAADTRLFASEQHMYSVNVEGTRNVIAFAEAGRPKALHLMSTMSVAGQWGGREPRPFSESDLDYGQNFRCAYERSKLRAEDLLRQFAARGGIGWTHRLGSLAAPTGPGCSQIDLADNRITQTIRLYARYGVAPALADEPLLLTPVDLTAKAVVTLATRGRLEGGTTHLISDSASDHEEIIEILRRAGHEVEILPPGEFRQRTFGARSGELVRWWLSHGGRRVRFQSQRTAALLAECNVSMAVDCRETWLERVVSDALRLADGEAHDQG